MSKFGSNGYYQPDNYSNGSSNSFSDFVITRFKVNNVNQNIGIREESNINSAISVYPNPTGSNVFIKLKEDAERLKNVQIFDVNGRLVYYRDYVNQTPSEGYIKVDLGKMVSGVYTISVNNKHHAKVIKL